MIHRQIKVKCILTVVVCASSLLVQDARQASNEIPAYRNPDLAPEKRAVDLVSRLTLQEKVLQMQNVAPAIPRLEIPAYDWWNEALHGVARAGRATVFPQAIALAATWDTDLMHRVADTISTEARAKYNRAQREGDYSRYHGLTFWSPNINIFRDPRWGRGQETYGEDPFLTAKMAVAFVRGMQGDDPHYLKTVATPKHFAVHSGPEPLRHSFDVHPSETDLNETYLAAFRTSVMEGRVSSIMCSYNRVDSVPACASSFLLQQHLRDAWGFQGYVVSDCGAVTDMVDGHKYKTTMPEAAAAAVKAGTDLTCGDEYTSLVEAVQKGLISEAEIDHSLTRLFTARMRLGMFDPAERVPFSRIGDSENDSAEHRQLALQAARESIVLLKNDSANPSAKNDDPILPLKSVKRIAVIGPVADDPIALLANYHGTASHAATPLAGIRKQFGDAEIHYALGSTYSSVSKTLVPTDVLLPETKLAGGKSTDAHGLLAEYFSNPDLMDEPRLSRVEPQVYLQREREEAAIESRLPHNGYSVRWSGSLRAPYSGEYELGVVPLSCEDCLTDDAARVFLDDRLILEDAEKPDTSSPAKTIKLQLQRGQKYQLRVEYRQHSGGVGVQLLWIPPAQPLQEEAVDAIQHSDVALLFVGLNSGLEGEEMPVKIPGFSGGDRTSLDLPELQEKLLEAASKTGKPLVVILSSGSALSVNFAAGHAAAVLESWYGGEEAGTAIAETLAGENNPSGRLPVTFYHSVDDLPPFEDYAMRGRTYRYFAGNPLYAFGSGLSYSSFRYSDLRIEKTSARVAHLHISAKVQNTSAREGDEVIQLYVGRDHPSAEEPVRDLRGFQRIHLAAGETKTAEFDLDLGSLHSAAPNENRKIHISVGGGQPISGIPHVEAVY